MPERQTVSPSHDQQAANRGIALLERFDGMSGLRNGLRRIAGKLDEWAGVPMPLDSHDLVVEPKYAARLPRFEELLKQFSKPADEAKTDDGAVLRNSFWSSRMRGRVYVYEEGGKVQWGLDLESQHQLDKMVHTLGASDAWGIEQEKNAVDTLATLLRHRQFKQYLLTGMFMERSERSGVHYLFRRLRPTVAIGYGRSRKFAFDQGVDRLKVLCALCLHPIGYYADSWAGVMCPTDDVIAHLMLMRGDEHMLWRRANQHPAWESAAGIS